MSSISNIVDYFKSCYQVDFKAINILNFYGNKVTHQLILDSPELLSGKLMQFPVDSKWGAEMEQTLALHSQEKELYCCSFFISGKMNIIGKPQKVFIPLYIHPVSLILEHEVYYLCLDAENAVINPAFPEFIKTQYKEVNLHYDDFEAALPKGHIRFEEIYRIEKALQKLIPELDTTALEKFPELYTSAQLKSQYNKRSKEQELSILPGVGIGLIQKASGSKGILNELSQMVSEEAYSGVISDLFSEESQAATQEKAAPILSPVTLSKNQLQIFESFARHRLSLVISPPGTGKSFTIAALAVDLISQGKSVLIASKNNQGGAVIAQKIEQDFGLKGVVIKTSGRTYRTLLQNKLNNIFYGMETQNVAKTTLLNLEKEIQTLRTEINSLKAEVLKREDDELSRGAFLKTYQGSIFQKLKRSYIQFRDNNRQPLWVDMKTLDKSMTDLNQKTKIYIRKKFDYHLYKTLRQERKELQSLLAALNTDTGNLMQEYFDKINFNVILHALPAWIVNATDVHKILPLIKDLFDVVIIDEATQCDISSALPLLQRGKKAIIVGDPKQLRHISFLSRNQQQQFAVKHNIPQRSRAKFDYKKNSLLDLASHAITSQNQVHFLDEHFRSMPDIIDFSNRHFYENKLKLMKATPITLQQKSVFLHAVNGTRTEKGFNPKEAEDILKMLVAIIEKEAKLHKNLCQSIGILSPFRVQVNYIKSEIRKAINTKNLKRHQILIGTPHQFQGEERDIMMLSFCVDKQTHPSTFIYLNKPDVFNVSITRAAALQHIFTSVSAHDLNPDYLFAQFLQQAESIPASDNDLSGYNELDEFTEDVVKVLESCKADQIYKAYPIAGIEIDIVVLHQDITYCIDLVGYPGVYENLFPLERWKMLERVGAKTFTLPYSAWVLNRERCIRALKNFMFKKKKA